MKIFTTALVIACSFPALMFSSCRKEKVDIIPSAAEYLVGKWYHSHIIYDANDDNVFDSTEISPVGDSITYILNEDGTGYLSFTPIASNHIYNEQSFKWILSNYDKELEIRFEDEHYYYYSRHTRIIKLNGTDCILQIDSIPNGNVYAQQMILKKI
ncbi:MAG TPA: lipocalin family protein [Flavipsychrobacter sp.]